jgi:hypothetical protein
METKELMLAQHVSQIRWMGAHRGLDMSSMMKSCAWFRGRQAGVPFAEGFQTVSLHSPVEVGQREEGSVLSALVGGGTL